MGIAASMGAGLIEANRTGGTVKRPTAAGPPTPASAPPSWRGGPHRAADRLEGRFGFFRPIVG